MTARYPIVLKSGVQSELGNTDVLAVYNYDHASTSLYSGGALSINVGDNTKVDIAALTAVFMNYTDVLNPVATNSTFGPFVGVTLPDIALFPSTYLGIDSTGTLHKQAQPFTPSQRRTILPLGLAIHTNNVIVNVTNNISAPNLALLNQFQDLMNALGPMNIAGNLYAANGANLSLDKSAGTIFKYGVSFLADATNPHEITIGTQTALTFRYRQANSAEGADTTLVDPTQWDDAGTLSSVGNNDYSIQRIFLFQSGLTRIQYGQATYSSLASALAAINTEAFTAEANIAANGVAMGVLVVKGNATDLSDTNDARFIAASKFGSSVAAGASALAFVDIANALGYVPVNKAGDTLNGSLNWASSVSLASATTTDIGVAASNTVTITGSTTITALGTIASGAMRWVTFSNSLTLTHNATSLILPTGANIQTAAGDASVFESLGSGNWRCVSYVRANSVPATLNGTEILTNKTLINPSLTNFTLTQHAPSAGSTFTVDLSNGTLQKFETTASTTITLPASVAGKRYVVMVAYGGIHGLTWAGGTSIRWSGNAAPVPTSLTGRVDVFEFICDGSATYGRAIGSNY